MDGDTEYTIRVVLAEAARNTVKMLREIDPQDVSMLSWYHTRLESIHAAYQTITGYPMTNVHREGVTFD